MLTGISGERLIVDCGGGVVETRQNLPRLRELGTVYWVRAPAAVLRERLSRPKHRKRRPALAGVPPAEEVALVLDRRTPLYREAAEADAWSTASDREAIVEAVETLLAAHFGPPLALVVSGGTALRTARGPRRGGRGPRTARPDRAATRRSRRTGGRRNWTGSSPTFPTRFARGSSQPSAGGARAAASREAKTNASTSSGEAGRRGAAWLDLEFEADRETGGESARRLRQAVPDARLIASFHDPEGAPPDLEALPGQMASMQPAIAKVAVAAAGWSDVKRVHDLIRAQKPRDIPVIGIAMGEAGAALRVIAGSAGAAALHLRPPRGSSRGRPRTAHGGRHPVPASALGAAPPRAGPRPRGGREPHRAEPQPAHARSRLPAAGNRSGLPPLRRAARRTGGLPDRRPAQRRGRTERDDPPQTRRPPAARYPRRRRAPDRRGEYHRPPWTAATAHSWAPTPTGPARSGRSRKSRRLPAGA